jgi:hypothetical protein
MLSDLQQDQLLVSLFATAEAMGQQLTQGAALVMVDDLKAYTEQALTGALKACRREGGRLTVSAIVKHADGADGRPGKDEAWSIALAGSDEFETVVMTAEIQQAMSASAPILASGDKVGARMAFMSAYERLVSQARAEAAPVRWSVSLGFDSNRRLRAIESAQRMHLITQVQAAGYLADLRITPISQDGLAIAGLISGEVREASPDVQKKLAGVRKLVEAERNRQRRAAFKLAQALRVNTYLRKRKARVAVAAALALVSN